MSRRVIVTGAAGFVGRHVAKILARRGCQVVGIGHGTWSHEEASTWGVSEWHATDISVDALVNVGAVPNAVVHCAGSGSVGYSLGHPFQDFSRSCVSVAATLEYLRLRAPTASLVYLSSAAVYGQRDERAISEDVTIAPVSPYGVHKSIGESLCRMYGSQYGVRSAVVRLFSVYGNGLRKQLLWDACSKCARGDVEFAGDGTETRDWIDVEDAATLVTDAIGWSGATAPVFNGGTGAAPTVREVLAELLSGLGSAEQPSFTGAVRAGDPKHYRADISNARSQGWAPRVGWGAGVRAFAVWYRTQQA
jgi:UDP-glucose 4-epimerase